MKYLDVYPNCEGCPMYATCGTMIQSIKACNSYNPPNLNHVHSENRIRKETAQVTRQY